MGGVLRLVAVVVNAKFTQSAQEAWHVRLIAAGEVGAGVIDAKIFSHLFKLGRGHVRGGNVVVLLSECGGSGLLGLGSLLGGAGVLTLREIGAGVLGAESVHGGLVA